MWIWFRMTISERSGGICVFYSSQSAAHLEKQKKKKLLQTKNQITESAE